MYVAVCGCVYEAVCGFVYTLADAFRGQKRVSEFLEPELHVVVSYLKWVLGTELGSSERAVCAKINLAKSVDEIDLESDTFKEKNE